ncbi:M20/M25/M40 family metallo-hydrolase [Kitasatospora sp. NPDC096077]|uniref:M20/M25/M40 family metallo-hydrolase n=1 Tax=Kitasatospora sp. NPDC096077 TaxID=3155544 RepID=UPI00332C3A46
MTRPLYVLKLGSSTLEHPEIFDEVAELSRRGARVLLVSGGAAGIERHYRAAERPIPWLDLPNGDRVRHMSPDEVPHVIAAYEQYTLPLVEAGLTARGLRVFTGVAARTGLVSGRANRPLKVVSDGRTRIVRDHRAGVVTEVDAERLTTLLDAFDVVCVSPPVLAVDGGAAINVDADVLAAEVSNAVAADHLRLVTGSAGLLTDPADPGSTLRHAHEGEAAGYAAGRMRQKVRAAELALAGAADVAITGPHTLARPDGWTRFWRTREPAADLELLSRAVQIPSVSEDERELAAHLVQWCTERGIDARIDEAGNLVAVRGDGPRRLLLLGHLDTVPFHWPAHWDGETLHGRGSVDAKASLVAFLEVLAEADVPADGQLRVVGAVEEEISSSKGAFHVRDHYPADGVVVGEPSGAGALTIGYFGLFKLRVTATVSSGHSAGYDALSAPDALLRALERIRTAVLKEAPAALDAVIGIENGADRGVQHATGVLNFRVPPEADLAALRAAAREQAGDGVEVTELRATPGVSGGRTSPLAKAFGRAFAKAGVRPRFLVKKGTSDMNTLATTWQGVPMVAYGAGDAALDHTDREHVTAEEYRAARGVLAGAVAGWFAARPAGTDPIEQGERS